MQIFLKIKFHVHIPFLFSRLALIQVASSMCKGGPKIRGIIFSNKDLLIEKRKNIIDHNNLLNNFHNNRFNSNKYLNNSNIKKKNNRASNKRNNPIKHKHSNNLNPNQRIRNYYKIFRKRKKIKTSLQKFENNSKNLVNLNSKAKIRLKHF